jgi:iron complex outermembrane receptor protein
MPRTHALAALAAAFLMAASAAAQTTSPPAEPAGPPAKPTTVSGLTVQAQPYKTAGAVTATKTDSPILETPLNVQVVTQETLQDQAAFGLDQALRNVSGVTVGAGGAADNGQPYSAVFLRGFSTDAHFRDGVRLDSFGSDSGTELTQFANIESVTVLKGPAAILYGAVEPGGIVNIVTKQPQATPVYSIEQQVGAHALYRTVVDATGPLTANGALLYRLDASYQNSGSPTQFIYDRTLFIAPVVSWAPDASDLVKLEIEYRDANFGQNYGYEPQLNGAFLNTDIATNYAEPSPDHERTFLVGLSWTHAFNAAWSLKEQTLLNNIQQGSAGILPFYISTAADTGVETPSGIVVGRAINQIHGNDYTLSENIDLVGHFAALGVQNTLLFGGDFVRFEYRGGIMQAGQLDGNISWIDAYAPVHPGTPFSPGLTPFVSDNQQVNSAGVYLQDQASLPHDLHLLAGLRFQYVDQNSAFGFAGAPITSSPVLDADAVTPRVGLLWQPQHWIGLYANYAGNFGPSNGAPLPNGQVAPPTSARSWEIGFKTQLAQGRLTASADYYDLTKTNLPTPDPTNPNFELVIGAARSRGVEVDIQGEIGPGWNVIANYAYTDARITQASSADFYTPGTPLGEVPRNTAHLWTTYQIAAGAMSGLKLGGGATYTGPEPYLYAGPNPPNVAAWRTFDLMAAYDFRVQGRKVTAQINATNVLDRRYFSDIQAAGFPGVMGYAGVTALFGAPRTIIGALKVDF